MSSSEEENSTSFCPSDQELVMEYLLAKNSGLPLPTNNIVDHDDLRQCHPDEIAEAYEERNRCWYFFTPNTRKYKSSRLNQAAGLGYWKAAGADLKVKNKDDVVGWRKQRVYYTKDGDKTNWMMHEFSLNELARGLPITDNDDKEKQQPQRAEEWLLCRIYMGRGMASVQDLQERIEELNI